MPDVSGQKTTQLDLSVVAALLRKRMARGKLVHGCGAGTRTVEELLWRDIAYGRRQIAIGKREGAPNVLAWRPAVPPGWTAARFALALSYHLPRTELVNSRRRHI